MDRGTWRATVHGVVKTWTRLRDFHGMVATLVEGKERKQKGIKGESKL